MAFNKAKVLQEADYLASQGKISQAINRYFNIFEKDPSELILLNTIGDLYVRDRNVAEGLKQFYRLAEAYVQGGYTLKAIAIYKKISKLEPDSVGPLLKVCELYQAQGLVRETRELCYQVAEFYKKKNQNDKALETLRKAVQLDVENATARARLAAFCEEIGRKDEALKVHLETAQLALRRQDTEVAELALKKAQELNSDDPGIYLLRARKALVLKHPEEVEAILSGAPGLKEDAAGHLLLIESQVDMRQFERAETLALDRFRAAPSDFSPLACLVSACVGEGELDVPSRALSAVADGLIEQGNTSPLLESLRLIRSNSPQHVSVLELIFRICDKNGDAEGLAEILEALGQAYSESGQFEKAEQSFQMLLEREPDNERYQALLGQVSRREPEGIVDTPTAGPPFSSAPMPEDSPSPSALTLGVDDRAAVVKEALENSELYSRFHLLSRAVEELERVLEVYPDETEIHKRLVGLCWKDLPERAEQAAQALAKIYAQQGDADGAKRIAQMVARPERVAAVEELPPEERGDAVRLEPLPSPLGQPAAAAAEEIDLAFESLLTPVQHELEVPLGPTRPLASPAPPSALLESPLEPAALELPLFPSASTSEVQEIDLTQDLESFLAQMAKGIPVPESLPQVASFNYDDSRTEINFYLEHGFLEEANAAIRELERTLPGDPRITELRALVDAPAGAPASKAGEERAAEALETASVEDIAPPVAFSAPAAAPGPAAREEIRAAPAIGVSAETSADLLRDFAEGFESAMERLEGPAVLTAPAPGLAPKVAAPTSSLDSSLSEQRAETGEPPISEPRPEDDLEAHYNLGVAYWEMNRLDDAIGEFQKVVKGAENSRLPPNYMQACNLLATCFMGKGMAPLAVKWYCRALETPNLEEAVWLALRYDLGVAYERAGDLPRAWENFTEVYGHNEGFRDIAEKVRTFQQKGS
jgi:tetratricopeptide (TPR) repeat protein